MAVDETSVQDTQQNPDDQASSNNISDQQQLLDVARDPDAVSSALAHEREKAKQLKAKLAEYEDRDKSEQQKLAERVSNAEKKAQDAELRALRYEVAVEKGLVGEKAALATRLMGTTKEELVADADQLLDIYRPPEPPPTSFDGGSRGTPPNAGGMDGLIRGAARRG